MLVGLPGKAGALNDAATVPGNHERCGRMPRSPRAKQECRDRGPVGGFKRHQRAHYPAGQRDLSRTANWGDTLLPRKGRRVKIRNDLVPSRLAPGTHGFWRLKPNDLT